MIGTGSSALLVTSDGFPASRAQIQLGRQFSYLKSFSKAKQFEIPQSSRGQEGRMTRSLRRSTA